MLAVINPQSFETVNKIVYHLKISGPIFSLSPTKSENNSSHGRTFYTKEHLHICHQTRGNNFSLTWKFKAKQTAHGVTAKVRRGMKTWAMPSGGEDHVRWHQGLGSFLLITVRICHRYLYTSLSGRVILKSRLAHSFIRNTFNFIENLLYWSHNLLCSS